MGQLSRMGFFFAMRSREYLNVPRAELGRTKILLIRNIRFVRNGRNVSHDDPALEMSDCIAITFEMQKKEEKNDTVFMRTYKLLVQSLCTLKFLLTISTMSSLSCGQMLSGAANPRISRDGW